MPYSQYLLVLVLIPLLFWTFMVHAESPPSPYPPDALLKGILDFREPTGIRGYLRYLERKKQTLWLEWVQVAADETTSLHTWQQVPNEWTIAVHPLNQSQFYILQQLAIGTALEMTIQLDSEGIRRILSFQELTVIPTVDSRFPLASGFFESQPPSAIWPARDFMKTLQPFACRLSDAIPRPWSTVG